MFFNPKLHSCAFTFNPEARSLVNMTFVFYIILDKLSLIETNKLLIHFLTPSISPSISYTLSWDLYHEA